MPRILNISRSFALLTFCLAATGLLYGQSVAGSISGVDAPGMAIDPLTNKIYLGGTLGVVDSTTDEFTPNTDPNADAHFSVGVSPNTDGIFVADAGNG